MLFTFLTSIVVIVLPNVIAQDYCYSSQDCSGNSICSTEQGECLAPPDCSLGNCVAVCAGRCIETTSSSNSKGISLTAPLSLDEVFVTTLCPNGCDQLLWLKLVEGITQKLKIGTSISIQLEEYDTKLSTFSPILSVVKPLASPDGTIDSFSIQLPPFDPLKKFPTTDYYKLKITYNLEEYIWYIKIKQQTPEHSPGATKSALNISSKEFQDFIDPIAAPIVVTRAGTYFPDLPDGSLIRVAAYNLSARTIISGYPDGTFKPLNLVNRAEAAKFLLNSRFQNIIVKPGFSKFPDVQIGAWYEKFIQFASSNGIITGYPDGTFKPGNTVNTAEFLKMLTLTFDLPLNLPNNYIDVNTGDWFAQYAGTASYYSLFPKRVSYALYPDMQLTREEVAIAINALIVALDKK